MPPELQPTPSEILEERINDMALKRRGPTPEQLDALFELTIFCIRTIVIAGNAGNVTCQTAAPIVLSYLTKLK